jgi:hypothetical protein
MRIVTQDKVVLGNGWYVWWIRWISNDNNNNKSQGWSSP